MRIKLQDQARATSEIGWEIQASPRLGGDLVKKSSTAFHNGRYTDSC